MGICVCTRYARIVALVVTIHCIHLAQTQDVADNSGTEPEDRLTAIMDDIVRKTGEIHNISNMSENDEREFLLACVKLQQEALEIIRGGVFMSQSNPPDMAAVLSRWKAFAYATTTARKEKQENTQLQTRNAELLLDVHDKNQEILRLLQYAEKENTATDNNEDEGSNSTQWALILALVTVSLITCFICCWVARPYVEQYTEDARRQIATPLLEPIYETQAPPILPTPTPPLLARRMYPAERDRMHPTERDRNRAILTRNELA
eukprot:1332908-Rhodomonas_salina.2